MVGRFCSICIFLFFFFVSHFSVLPKVMINYCIFFLIF